MLHGLNDAEHMALLEVKRMLGTNEVIYNPKPVLIEDHDIDPPDRNVFNMDYVIQRAECGTVYCIGGFMAMLLGEYPYGFVSGKRDTKIHELFMPSNVINWSEITKEQAIKAIDNFIESGDPRWKEVMG